MKENSAIRQNHQQSAIWLHRLQTWLLCCCFILATSASADSKKIGIIVFDGFLTSDVTAPLEVFGAATKHPWFSQYQVMLISTTRETTVVSEEGLAVVADATIYDPIDLDVVIAASAYDMAPVLANKALIQFIKNQQDQSQWFASNCSGAFLLAEAGLLDGKKATTWFGGEAELAEAYPKINVQYNQNVVVDSGVMTSNGGPVSYQSAFQLLAKLTNQKHADEIAEQIQFDRLATAFKP